jgi:aspartyl-tRNA(Asn)/glutamyl-tRNA(Gln) amidotransferase subunit B
VQQETLGWDDTRGQTLPQRGKEEAHDYRYFPEPDLPPLTLEGAWIGEIRSGLPELPEARRARLVEVGLSPYQAGVIAAERSTADYFETVIAAAPAVPPRRLANWMAGELFGLLNEMGTDVGRSRIRPEAFAELVAMVEGDFISPATAKGLLERLAREGGRPSALVRPGLLDQISDPAAIDRLVKEALQQHPDQVEQYLGGKRAIAQWLFGQVMRSAGGRAKPAVVQASLSNHLAALEKSRSTG